jgi:hypothetical protein
MSVGNQKTQGGKSTNYPFQFKLLKLTEKLEENINITNTLIQDLVDNSTIFLTPGVIAASSLSFPYSTPNTFYSVSLIVPLGETIEFNGVTLQAGTYNFGGTGNQKLGSFTLDNPSGTGVYILTLS